MGADTIAETIQISKPKPITPDLKDSTVVTASDLAQTQVEIVLNNTETRKNGGKAIDVFKVPKGMTYALYDELYDDGEILPDHDNFSQLLTGIGKKIGLPSDFRIIALDSDMENAFFMQKEKTLVFSRGLAKRLLINGLDLSEDHLAAILCHELEHQHTEDRIDRRTGIWFLDVKSNHQMQSEELRADSDGMMRLAKAGYNPRAMIDTYKAIGLTAGRDDRDHPEMIDRIRHLEGKLYDDINPIPNTGKTMQELEKSILDYLKEDSNVYEATEALLSLSADELKIRALQSNNIEEFWKFYDLERHARRVEYARTLCKKISVANFVRKAILFEAISDPLDNSGNKRIIIDGKLQPQLEPAANKIVSDSSQTARSKNENAYLLHAYEDEKLGYSLMSLPYRMGLQEMTVDKNSETDFESRLADTNKALDEIITLHMDTLDKNKDRFPPEFSKHIEKVKHLLSDDHLPIDADTLSTVYVYYDSRFQEEDFAEQNETRNKRGLRRIEKPVNQLSVDFAAPLTKQKTLESISLSTAIQMLNAIPEDPEMKNHFSRLLEQTSGLASNEARLFADFYFHKNETEWFSYLETVPREELPILSSKLCSIPHHGHFRPSHKERGKAFDISWQTLNSKNTLNQGYLETRYPYLFRKHPFFTKYDNPDANPNPGRSTYAESVSLHCTWELYKRGLPHDYNLLPRWKNYYLENPEHNWHGFDKSYNGIGMNLTKNEWEFVSGNLIGKDDFIDVNAQRKTEVLYDFLDSIKTGKNINPDTLDTLKNFHSLYINIYGGEHQTPFDFSMENILLLCEHSPWPPKTLAVFMTHVLRETYFDIENLSPQQREKIIPFLKDFYINYPTDEKDSDYLLDYHETGRNNISGWLLDLYTPDIPKYLNYNETYTAEQENRIVESFSKLHDEGFQISPNNLGKFKDIRYQASRLTLEKLVEIFVNQTPINSAELSLSEELMLYTITPVEILRDSKFTFHTVYPETIDKLFEEKDGTESLNWILKNFHSCVTRDFLLAGLAEKIEWDSTDPNQQEVKDLLIKNFSGNQDTRGSCNNNRFSYLKFPIYNSEAKKGRLDSRIIDLFKGDGKLRDCFPDILRRRHAFSLLARPLHDSKLPDFLHMSSESRAMFFSGNHIQRWFAQELYAQEKTLLDNRIPLQERLDHLKKIDPFPSPERDTYVEFIFEEELKITPDPQKRFDIEGKVLPLFSENCDYGKPYVLRTLRDEIMITSDFYTDSRQAISRILHYLPEASLSRNYFLDQIEENCSLTPEDVIKITNLRISDEGQRQRKPSSSFFESDAPDVEAAPEVYVINRLSEQNREEKCKSVLWILGISNDKPLAVETIEKEEDGSLDSFKTAFSLLTPPERNVLLKRLFLGAEGILDLESLSPQFKQEAIDRRDSFLKSIAESFIPKGSAESELFQDIFVTIFQNADPARASQILSKLINSSIDSTLTGKKLTKEQLVAQTLNQIGVVGKKVSQSLSEMDWIPDSYRKELSKSQEGAEVLPLRSLMQFAENAGLISGNSGLRIKSFDKLLGAASNKQACLMTFEVTDSTISDKLKIQIGESIQLVGKFKRPSAQKTENIDQDLFLMQKVVETIQKRNHSISMPPGFTDQIGIALKQELDFQNENEFSEKLGDDISKRNQYRGYHIEIPEIIFSNDDLIIEKQAKGVSLREFIDHLNVNNPAESKIRRRINAVVVREALYELLLSGNIHSDLHPGNVFYDQDNNIVTLIDLGMNTYSSSRDIISTRELIFGLALGNKSITFNALKNLGWEVSDKYINLALGKFPQNSRELLSASKRAAKPPPTELGMIILSVSKLEPYLRALSAKEILSIIGEIIPGEQRRLHLEALALEKTTRFLEKLIKR